MSRHIYWCILLMPIILVSSCSSTVDIKSLKFDGQAAYDYLVQQVELGPRVPNSEAHRTAREMFVEHFKSCGAGIELQEFTYRDPYSGDTLYLTNIIARFNPERDDRLLLCAHWECRPRCELDPDTAKRSLPLPGANDGASGTALLMQLAVEMKSYDITQGVDIILFDAEDWGEPGDLDNYMIGSRYFAKSVNAKRYRYAILLDMIAEKDAKYLKEGFSLKYAPDVVEKVWQRASLLGMAETFVDSVGIEIHDDHLSLLTATIPAIDIIDFDYRWWHTREDTPDKCSAESLARAGRLVLSVVLDPP